MSPPAKYACLGGEIIPWDEAKVHVYSPVVKFGAGVFEGIRGYWNEDAGQMYVFRLREHLDRLHYSQLMMRYEPIVDVDLIGEKLLELLRANEFRENVHIRPTVFVDGYGGSESFGPIQWAISAAARPMPKRVEDGCTVQISSWERISDRAMPMRVKAHANYNNSRFSATQALVDGYDTSLMLNRRGKVSEGPGMCFFMVRHGVPVTPSVTNDILESITRDTVLQLFREQLDLPPVERDIDRSEIPAAEEAFFCGTGWEITPVKSVDRIPIGGGEPGPVTRRLQDVYFDVVHGRTNLYQDWLTPVYA